MDIIKRFEVSQYPTGEHAMELALCFDNGSPYTFITRSSALKIGRLMELATPAPFAGLGDGTFQSKEIMHLYVKLLEFWCRQLAYVVEDGILERRYDILVGHDFMQRYGIKLLPHEGGIEIDETRLSLAQRVRLISKFLYDALVGAPLTLGKQMLEKIRDEVDRERLVTEDSIKERLQQLQLALQDGEISEEEYEDLETKLMERLRAVREYKRSQGG